MKIFVVILHTKTHDVTLFFSVMMHSHVSLLLLLLSVYLKLYRIFNIRLKNEFFLLTARLLFTSPSSVTVMMDEQQVEVPAEVGDAEMDGAIRGILCAAAGEPATEGEVSGCEGEGRGTQEGSPAPTQTPTSRKWSAVWVHYRKVDQEKKALCLLCMEKIQHQSSTSNLIRHLQNKHPAEYAQLEEHSQKRPPKRKSEDPDYVPATSPKTRTVTPSRIVPSQLSSSLTGTDLLEFSLSLSTQS